MFTPLSPYPPREPRKRLKRRTINAALKDLWRTYAAWVYLIICMFDFLVAPILLALYSANLTKSYIEWKPLTIMGGGVFHLSMGAILGVSAYAQGKFFDQYMAHNFSRAEYYDDDDDDFETTPRRRSRDDDDDYENKPKPSKEQPTQQININIDQDDTVNNSAFKFPKAKILNKKIT